MLNNSNSSVLVSDIEKPDTQSVLYDTVEQNYKKINQRKVLIVDDEKVNHFILEKILRKNGFGVFSCFNGEDALKEIKKNQFDLVLMDIMMPVMDGLTACKHITTEHPYLPIIILTAMDDDETVKHSFAKGAVDFIKKPFHEVNLTIRMLSAIRLKKAEERYTTMHQEMLEDISTAAKTQLDLMPPPIINHYPLIVSSNYDPCQKVGGDLYDVICLDKEEGLYFVYIGDVAGHGMQAAMLMATIKASISRIVVSMEPEDITPKDVLNELIVHKKNGLFINSYATMVAASLNLKEGRMCLLSAGHPPPIIFDAETNTLESLPLIGGMPVGWQTGENIYDAEDEIQFDFKRGQSILFYTDGLLDCETPDGEQLGMEGLEKMTQNALHANNHYALPWILKEQIIMNGYDTKSDDFALLYLTHTKPNMHSKQKEKKKTKKNHEVQKSSASKKHVSKSSNKNRDVKYLFEKVILTTASLEKTSKAIQEIISSFKLQSQKNNLEINEKVVGTLELILEEYLTNIVVHGYGKENSDLIFVQLLWDDEGNKKITIIDKGKKWNLLHSSKKNLEVGMAETCKTGGYGLFLIGKLSTHFKLQRRCEINETIIKVEDAHILSLEE